MKILLAILILCGMLLFGCTTPSIEDRIKQNLSDCRKGGPHSSQECIYRNVIMPIAKMNNASLCKGVGLNCYGVVAFQTKNSSVCALDDLNPDACYEQYAYATNNSSACEKITLESRKNRCLGSIGH